MAPSSRLRWAMSRRGGRGPAIVAACALLLGFWATISAGDELQWRPPKKRAKASQTEDSGKGNSSKQSPIRGESSRPTNVLRTNHQEDVQDASADVTEGPRLIAAGEERKEPRKLKSVLVRRPSQVRPIQQAEGANQAAVESSPQDANTLRTVSGGENDRPAWQLVAEDPFESGHAGQASDVDAGGANQPEPLPLRVAQRDGAGRPTRSVLRQDPFEGPSGNGQFVSQLGDADAADSPAGGPQAPQIPSPGRITGTQDIDTFAPDTSYEAERDRAAAVCTRALEVIRDKRIDTLSIGISVEGTVGDDLPFECALDTEEYESRDWTGLTYMWKASALCHKPLYFEDVHLERYGHSWGWHLQPFVSGAHFFTTLPILPYKMGLQTPNECVYSLGYYRPGNCAPYLIEPLGTSPRAVVWQTGAVVGFSAIVP